MPLGVLAGERSWFVARPDACPAERPAGIQRRHRRRARHCQDASHGVGRRSASQHAVSTYPVPSSGARRSGPVRCPARPVSSRLVRRPGSGVRPSAVHPSGVQPSGVRPRRSGRVRLVPHQVVAVGDRPMRQGNPRHGNGLRSRWAAGSSSGSGRRRVGPDGSDAAEATHGRRGGRWRIRAGSAASGGRA